MKFLSEPNNLKLDRTDHVSKKTGQFDLLLTGRSEMCSAARPYRDRNPCPAPASAALVHHREAILTEVVYGLSSPRSPYRLSHEEIRDRLVPLLTLGGLKVPAKRFYLRPWISTPLPLFSTSRTLWLRACFSRVRTGLPRNADLLFQ